jgi:hypothetical protein
VIEESSGIAVYEVPAPEAPGAAAHRTWQAYFARRARMVPGRRWGVAVSAALICLVLHLLLVGSALWRGRTTQPQLPQKQGVGANATGSEEDAVMTLVLIDDPAVSPANNPRLEEFSSRGRSPRDLLSVRIVSPDSLPAVQVSAAGDPAEDVPAPASDSAQHAVLVGRYLGQINARIDRAWRRPRSSLGDALFQCSVKISQDRAGTVLEIELQNCTDDAKWQQSLAQAIQSASPLPAPPDPAIFADDLTLSFSAVAYRPGANLQDYEPAGIIAPNAAEPAEMPVLAAPSFAGAAQGKLTITGIRRVNMPLGVAPDRSSSQAPRAPGASDGFADAGQERSGQGSADSEQNTPAMDGNAAGK